MRAWLCKAWGAPETLSLGELPEPPCPPGAVAIRVEAWGVNFADLVLVAGRYQMRPAFPFAPGMEVAGTIEEVGAEAAGFGVGDRVAAYVAFGGYAARVIAPAANLAALPENVPWIQAAAFPVPYATAALALDRGALRPGETVLVGGAGGAVGAACVALARLGGGRVIACAGDEAKAAVARACGAEQVLSSRTERLTEDVKALAPGGVDLILDPVGGAFFESALRTLGYGGRLVTLGFASGKIPSAPVNHLLVKQTSVVGSSLGLTSQRDPDKLAALWPPLMAQLAAGALWPRVADAMPFDQLPRALRRLAERSVAGRIVLKP